MVEIIGNVNLRPLLWHKKLIPEMYFESINDIPATFDLGDEIREEILAETLVLDLNPEDEKELQLVERSLRQRYLLGLVLTWPLFQFIIFTTVLIYFTIYF